MHLRERRALGQITDGAGVDRLVGAGRVVVHREHDNLRVGHLLGDPLGCTDAVEYGHREIHQDHVGLLCDGDLDGLLSVAGFAHDFLAGLLE